MLAIAEQFPTVPITIVMSTVHYAKGEASMGFRELSFSDHSALIEFLRQEQYTESDIKEAVFKDYDV